MKPTDGSLDPTLMPDTVSARGDTVGDTLSDGETQRAEPSKNDFKIGELLGRGGMGEVMLAEDVRIGRQVAVKRMRSAAPTSEATARFLREAKIQARLDHPAIVPVHELGYDAQGRPFFTMKRLTGTTLSDVLAGGRETQQKLLRVLVDVCQAIQFAHARGVIHRDLKPANIMLGEYGEVYVLDWGVARVVGDKETGTSADIESLDGETQVGAVLGTPGYMSPEQIRGEVISTATDVHALGAILFEVLAGDHAFPRGTNTAIVATLAGEVEAPSKRAPDRTIPPELDDACVKALAFEATSRPTAGELAEQIQRYLDGDRDLERRRRLAAELIDVAREAIASGDPARRAEAMRAAGRAMALDPESEAAALVSQLMLEPSTKLPPELEKRLDDIDLAVVQKQAGLASRAMMTYIVVIPLVLWAGVKDWTALIVAFAFLGVNFFFARRTSKGGPAPSFTIVVVLTCIMLAAFGRILGPFVFVPALMVGVCVSIISFPSLLGRPALVISSFIAAYYVPVVLEVLGVFGSTWSFGTDGLTLASNVVHFSPWPTTVTMLLSTTAMLFVSPMFVRTLAVMHRDARRHIESQAWHLEQLLPKRA